MTHPYTKTIEPVVDAPSWMNADSLRYNDIISWPKRHLGSNEFMEVFELMSSPMFGGQAMNIGFIQDSGKCHNTVRVQPVRKPLLKDGYHRKAIDPPTNVVVDDITGLYDRDENRRYQDAKERMEDLERRDEAWEELHPAKQTFYEIFYGKQGWWVRQPEEVTDPEPQEVESKGLIT